MTCASRKTNANRDGTIDRNQAHRQHFVCKGEYPVLSRFGTPDVFTSPPTYLDTVRWLTQLWQTMDTAPQDGTWLLTWCPSSKSFEIVQWTHATRTWATAEGGVWPSHWIPLPDRPAAARLDDATTCGVMRHVYPRGTAHACQCGVMEGTSWHSD